MPPSDRSWTILMPVLLVWLVFVGVIQAKHGFDLLRPDVWGYHLQKLARDGLLFMVIAGVLVLAPRMLWSAWVFAAFWLVLNALDLALYQYANSLLELHHFAAVDGEYLTRFLDTSMVARLAMLLLAIVGTAWLLRWCRRDVRASSVLRWSVLLTTFLLVVSAVGPRPDPSLSFEDRRRHCLLEYASRSSLLNLLCIVTERAAEYELDADPETHRAAIAAYSLPVGSPSPPPLGLAPFRKVVLVLSESLSLNLLYPYGHGLTFESTPFYSSAAVRERMFVNYWSCGLNTLDGLLVSLHSHPNARLFAAGRHENSFVCRLREQGFRTVLVRGEPRHRPPREALLRNAGFDEIYTKEHFEADPALRPFVRGLGAYDRVLYEESVRILQECREERVFLAVLGVDTHYPGDRVLEYADLDYPAPPPGLRGGGARTALLRSAFFHDHDVAKLVTDLRSAGLWSEDLLLVLTADHCIPCETDVLPGDSKGFARRIPLAFLSPRELPPTPREIPGSQLDLGPTILHLLGLPRPRGCWGESLFSPDRAGTYVSYQQGALLVENGDRRTIFALAHPATPEEAGLLALFRTLILR
jgi:phosphoglycerol transferase MdoB-like AlkP superfamily enzyme